MANQLRSGPLAPGIAFITGGARGLGNAIAVSYAREGAKGIALVDILDDKALEAGKAEVEKYGTKCITIRADVTREADVERAIAETVEAFGRIDYTANFAGILGSLNMSWDTSIEDFSKVINVNLIGVWICTKLQLKQMIKQDSIDVEQGRIPQLGSIVNCASVNSIQAGAGTSGYTTAKHGVVGITKTAALEARGHNIRVNCVSPGFLRTDLLKTPVANGEVTDDVIKEYERRQGRNATFDEVGDVVVLLSTPRMSLVNGHNLVIDGGFTINENTA
ncbi:oxidoreductase like protein [Zymoseptoria brevis]|uniref:Oxidoreductase like protein n=1 Tax=Zymoseptoria brevis TaxID=1047168 RepID=A0A0F4GKV4_9PEZI|nr:oxidoreductase like protein [Zymoseptoria brevis]